MEYFHDHVRILNLLFEGVPDQQNGCLYPDLSRAGMGLSLKQTEAKEYLQYQKEHQRQAYKTFLPMKKNTKDHKTQAQHSPAGKLDVGALEKALKDKVEGEVYFDAENKVLYSRDGSNYHQVPIGVVRPKNADDIMQVLAVCCQFGAPVLSRGGGTSLAGQCCNHAVVMDMSRHYHQVLEINEKDRLVRVQPGIVLDRMLDATKEKGLIFGPDPATHNHCAVGGILGNNSCGIHSVMAARDGGGARTSDNVAELDIVTYDGTRMTVGPTSEEEQEKIWAVRESGLGATAFVPDMKDTWPGWEDSAVHPDQLGDYLKELKELFAKYNCTVSVYGHFGQGLVHCRIPFDLKTDAGLKEFRQFMDDATELVLKYNGSISGEYGDGQARAELLEKMYGRELMEAFREFKRIWDPEGKMNPGKVIDADPILSNLRLGTNFNPTAPETYFQYPDDEYNFARSTLRCVGVGECRRTNEGTMCPSYMVTREEKHSTRGRATLLFEMLRGETIKDGWNSEEVKDALDLCMVCKGCKGDCPVSVDMATYKSEFLAHYYKKNRRPRHAYAFGFISKWAHMASVAPGPLNLLTHTGGMEAIAKKLPGMAPQRQIPKFAKQTFKDWFNRRLKKEGPKNPQGTKVILWPDTFNNYFYPDTAKAAVEVLEHAGYQVILPQKRLCCGRPLYDYGFLDKAKA